jgi:hypothetical protein
MALTKDKMINYNQRSDVHSKAKEFWNYVTGSAGGWPTLSRAGILAGLDFTIESGSNEVKFFENNTNMYSAQVSAVFTNFFPDIAQYAATQSYDNVIIYGSDYSNEFGTNPPMAQRGIISSSFADVNISSSFNTTPTNRQYLSMRGTGSFSGSFHLFLHNPEHTDDTLYQIVSSSFNKDWFRSTLSDSPVSSSLISTFDSSSISIGHGIGDWPDYVNKTTQGDASMQVTMGGKLMLNSYRADTIGTEQSSSAVLGLNTSTGNVNENFIISSGSVDSNNQKYSSQGRVSLLVTPEDTKIISSFYNPQHTKLYPPVDTLADDDISNDGWAVWTLKPYQGLSTPSGSLIRMYDDSTKQIQDVQIGDVVKSFQPIGMPDGDLDFLNYSTSDLSGSFMTGSVVVGGGVYTTPHYYTISGSDNNEYIFPQLGSAFANNAGSGTYKFKQTWRLDTDDKLFDKDGNEIDIVDIQENYDEEDIIFYSLDVEDIDTYFSSDILVHNIPGKD